MGFYPQQYGRPTPPPITAQNMPQPMPPQGQPMMPQGASQMPQGQPMPPQQGAMMPPQQQPPQGLPPMQGWQPGMQAQPRPMQQPPQPMAQGPQGAPGYNAQGAAPGMNKRLGGQLGARGVMSSSAPDLAYARQNARRQ